MFATDMFNSLEKILTVLVLPLLLLSLAGGVFGQTMQTKEYANGDVYVGEFRDGQRNGQGSHTYASGAVYVGEFRDDYPDGQGIQIKSAGEFNVGEYSRGQLIGQIIKTSADGDVYVGEYSDGQRNGQGTFTFTNGRVQNGIWEEDEFVEPNDITQSLNGQAVEVIRYGVRAFYVGEVRNGQRNGEGALKFDEDGATRLLVGGWRNDQPHGRGTAIFTAGEVYVGEFRDGPITQGTWTYSNGEFYVGEFRGGERHGQGAYTYTNGSVLSGIWRENVLVEPNNIAVIPVEPVTPELPESNELLQAASGSGFAVSSEGHIITNNHVIEGCENVRLHRQGSVIDAVVVSRDPLNDLAVIKADFSPSTVFAIDNSNPALMQDIYVAGYPFGENISSSIKVTRGIVSSLTGLGNNFSNMQIDAAIQPGNSGGPIFDESGNVIGVAVATLDVGVALEEFGTIPQNTNFGVKGSVVSNFLQSNGVEPVVASDAPRSTSELGQLATDATYYLSCWMTTAQIQQMSSTKVMFQGLGQ